MLRLQVRHILARYSDSDFEAHNPLSDVQKSGLRSLRFRLRTDDLIICVADKSGGFVVDRRSTYIQRMQPHLEGALSCLSCLQRVFCTFTNFE